jgi:hypothetical protein
MRSNNPGHVTISISDRPKSLYAFEYFGACHDFNIGSDRIIWDKSQFQYRIGQNHSMRLNNLGHVTISISDPIDITACVRIILDMSRFQLFCLHTSRNSWGPFSAKNSKRYAHSLVYLCFFTIFEKWLHFAKFNKKFMSTLRQIRIIEASLNLLPHYYPSTLQKNV